jgi:hypothetical protein
MKFGKKQWIVIIISMLVLVGGAVMLHTLPLEAAQTWLDFAGDYSWKAVAFITAAPAVGVAAQAIAERKRAP